MKSLFASTARGLEELLKKLNWKDLAPRRAESSVAGFIFREIRACCIKSLMWSRLASRIMLPLGECSVYSDLDLYRGFNRFRGRRSLPLTPPLRCILAASMRKSATVSMAH